MDDQDRVKQEPTVAEPNATVVPLVTITDESLATIVTTRDPEHTRRELAITWIAGSMMAIAMQLLVILVIAMKAQSVAEMTTFLETMYPLMLKFNLSVICPPVAYMIASYFSRKEASNKH
ncbi:MAG TPA: hypothetical protein VF432_10650 [Thermoanaerobaculia bacterium]